MDAYVFVRNADRATINNLRSSKDRRIRFVTELTGPYDAFAAVEMDTLKDLESVMLESVRSAGAHDTDTSIAVRIPSPELEAAHAVPMGIRRWLVPRTVECYTRIRVERGRADEIFDRVVNLDGFLGVAIVAGRYDILLALGGDTFHEVNGILLAQLHAIDGIRSTVSSFASNERDDSAV
jgi:hypothetical protein